MIFDRPDGDKEVWRRSSDTSEHVVDDFSIPDASQHEVYELYPRTSADSLFRPWAVLHMPEPTSAFRFVYPTLMVAAYDCVYLWDVPSGTLIQTIQEIQECQLIPSEDGLNHYLHRIMYVEISERHVFLVGQFYMRIFSRETCESIWDLSSAERGYGLWKYMPTNLHVQTPGSALERYEIASSQEVFELRDRKRIIYDRFVSGT